MKDNKIIAEWIDRFNNNDLHGKELEFFLKLMEEDPELRREVHADQEANKALSEWDIIELRRKINEVRIPKYVVYKTWQFYLMAASVTILVILSIHFFLVWLKLTNTPPPPLKQYALTDTSYRAEDRKIKPNQEEIDKETIDSAVARLSRGEMPEVTFPREHTGDPNFETFLPFEQLIGSISRSDYFDLLKPAINATFHRWDPIEFEWETGGSMRLVLRVTNNHGQKVAESHAFYGTKYTYYPLRLSPGLYYFLFINKDDILFFGKFNIR